MIIGLHETSLQSDSSQSDSSQSDSLQSDSLQSDSSQSDSLQSDSSQFAVGQFAVGQFAVRSSQFALLRNKYTMGVNVYYLAQEVDYGRMEHYNNEDKHKDAVMTDDG